MNDTQRWTVIAANFVARYDTPEDAARAMQQRHGMLGDALARSFVAAAVEAVNRGASLEEELQADESDIPIPLPETGEDAPIGEAFGDEPVALSEVEQPTNPQGRQGWVDVVWFGTEGNKTQVRAWFEPGDSLADAIDESRDYARELLSGYDGANRDAELRFEVIGVFYR